jgi:nucleoside-diphosphate-sugar epimerase
MALGARLARQGHTVCGLRRHATPELAAAGIQPVVADLTREESLREVRADFDWVVNCASSSHGDAADYRSVYVEGNRRVIEWLLRSGHLQRYVYTSSTGVYGQDDGSWVVESSPTEPGPETARVLVEAERLLLGAAAQRGFPAVVLRVAGIYGPQRGFLLRRFLEGAARVEGEGDRWMNMIHREDVAGAIEAALRGGHGGEVYNVVDDEPAQQITVLRWLSENTGKPMPAAVEKPPPGKRAVTSKRVSNHRLRSELGWRPMYPTFREGYAEELGIPQNTSTR